MPPLSSLPMAHKPVEWVARCVCASRRVWSDADRVTAGAGPDVVRLSVGIEDKADIIADLDQALATI